MTPYKSVENFESTEVNCGSVGAKLAALLLDVSLIFNPPRKVYELSRKIAPSSAYLSALI